MCGESRLRKGSEQMLRALESRCRWILQNMCSALLLQLQKTA